MTDPILVEVTRPIMDNISGETILESGDCGEVIGFSVDPGAPAWIPVKNTPDAQLNRRLKFDVQFTSGTYKLMYPEQFKFKDRNGLAQAIMRDAKINDVEELTPTPRFQSKIVQPIATTLVLDNGLSVTFIVDHTSGLLDMEVMACESS